MKDPATMAINENDLYNDNPEAQRALRIIEHTGTSVFLTGKAGTGKTTFLKRLCSNSLKRMVVLAPTGIAAINAGGSTIHSFFQFSFAPYIPDANYSAATFKLRKNKIKLIRSLDLIVIDEISMVRADLLDCIDYTLRRYRNHALPFGGVQLLLIGDLQQLAPVAKDEEWKLLSRYYSSPFFFASRALQQMPFVTIELKHIYRQSDPEFIRLLNLVRDGRADDKVLEALNRRYIPGFSPDVKDGYIRLLTHNHQAQTINESELAKLPGEQMQYDATVEGTFPENSYPTADKLVLKEGAQVMFVKNDAEKRYFNGMIGEVVALNVNSIDVRPIKKSDEPQESIVRVSREEWCNTKYELNKNTKEVQEVVEGRFIQFPLRLAWAITIHKSQGLTFEHAIINTHWAFAHGQTYVALSRCKTLEGMVLASPIPRQAIICDGEVTLFTATQTEQAPTDDGIHDLERRFYIETLSRLFDFSHLRYAWDGFARVVEEHLYKIYPAAAEQIQTFTPVVKDKMEHVGMAFHAQLERLVLASSHYEDDAFLAERVAKACRYFLDLLRPINQFVRATDFYVDNKVIEKRLKLRSEELREVLFMQEHLLTFVSENGFHLTEYLKERALAAIGEDGVKVGKKKAGTAKTTNGMQIQDATQAVRQPADSPNPTIFSALVQWRYRLSKDKAVPAFTILHQTTLTAIASIAPTTREALLTIHGFGEKKFEQYGEQILEIVRAHLAKE
jgi:hypothetical protein